MLLKVDHVIEFINLTGKHVEMNVSNNFALKLYYLIDCILIQTMYSPLQVR